MEPTTALLGVVVLLLIIGTVAVGSLIWDRYRQERDQP